MNCPKESPADRYRRITDSAKLSLATSAGCFATACLGCVLAPLTPNVICVEGLAVVGGFYFIIGAVDHFRARYEESISQQS